MRLALLLVFTLLVPKARCQTDPKKILFIGKRGNVVWDRKVTVFNLGNEQWNYYYRIYYSTPEKRSWSKIGFLGKRIAPFFVQNENANTTFLKFKKKKKQSYLLLGATCTTFLSWGLYTAFELNRTGDLKTYIKPIPLALLASYFVCFHFGKRTNIKGDIHLVQAVRLLSE